MIYHARKLHYVTQSLIPAGWLLVVALLTMKKSAGVESIALTAFMAVMFLTIFLYAFIKQYRTPLVETNNTEIKIHNVWKGHESAAWDLIIEIKKYPFFGYRLITIHGGIWLPVGMLSASDSQRLLAEVHEHLGRKRNQSSKYGARAPIG